MRQGSKVYRLLAALAAAVICFSAFCACAPTAEKDTVRVSVVDSVFFTAQNTAGKIERGGDFSVRLDMRFGYEFASCDYPDYTAERVAGGSVLLTLKNVERPSRVTVSSRKVEIERRVLNIDCSITYDYNGGYCADGFSRRKIDYELEMHLRPNTWNGAGLIRSGYTLFGWNTEPDGSGEHIGLGSRVTVPGGESVTLYAEWLEQIDESYFETVAVTEDACALTGYRGRGDAEPFVLPSVVDGRTVVEIAGGFTNNMRCGELTANTLVVPDTVRIIRDYAFTYSHFTTLCFADSMEDIEDDAFPYYFKTIHINAVRPPNFLDVNYSSFFADAADRLILDVDRKKLVLFSGCSFGYGANSEYMDKAFDGKYAIVNMGINGDINAAFQLDIILNYLNEGDILVHAPEQMSRDQLMLTRFTNDFIFIMTEGNYDLLSKVDFSENRGLWSAYRFYIKRKKESDACDYLDGIAGEYNVFGDMIIDRPYDESTEAARDVTYSDGEYCFEPEFLTDEAIERLTRYYGDIERRGAKVYTSYAPINKSARAAGEIERKGHEFAEIFERKLGEKGFSVISDVDDYMFAGRYFYDSDYHLNELGALIRTERLVADLKKAGVS